MMKKIFLSLMMLMFSAGGAYAAEKTDAETFVKQVTHEGIEQIINADVSIEKKDERFEKLFDEYFDLDYIGKFVLGRYWKTATTTQRADFIKAYREFNTKTWSKRFDEFKGRHFDFHGTTPSNSAGQTFVNTTVGMSEGAPAKVVFRVKEGDPMKIVDIIIENVSLAITARNEYTAYIQKAPNGIDDLIKDLKQKTK